MQMSNEPAVDLIVTTARLGRFFEEIGRPVTDSPQPPTPDELAYFLTSRADELTLTTVTCV